MPSASHRCISSVTASVSPASTTDETPLTAAIFSRSPHWDANFSACGWPQANETMPPAPPNRTSNRLRSATTSAASRSDRAPATYAAAISPCECPMTASGTTPTDRHNSASDTITAHNAGCTTSTRSSPGAPGAPRSTSSSDHSTCSRSARSQRWICSANTGAVAHNWAPMPSHCAPWPGNTNAVLPTVWARPATTSAPGTPAARPVSPSIS